MPDTGKREWRFYLDDMIDMLEGMVLGLNKKTISVATDDCLKWNVASGLLRLVQSP
jgi:hypothetical protein